MAFIDFNIFISTFCMTVIYQHKGLSLVLSGIAFKVLMAT